MISEARLISYVEFKRLLYIYILYNIHSAGNNDKRKVYYIGNFKTTLKFECQC